MTMNEYVSRKSEDGSSIDNRSSLFCISITGLLTPTMKGMCFQRRYKKQLPNCWPTNGTERQESYRNWIADGVIVAFTPKYHLPLTQLFWNVTALVRTIKHNILAKAVRWKPLRRQYWFLRDKKLKLADAIVLHNMKENLWVSFKASIEWQHKRCKDFC